MGRRRRVRAPQGPPVVEEHFRLLREYGKNKISKTATKQRREELWKFAVSAAKLPYVPLDTVIEHWKKYIEASSEHSSITITGEIDPKYTLLGVAFKGKVTAAHTTKTSALLKKVISIWAKNFPDRATFLDAAEALCLEIANRTFGKKVE